MAVCIDEFSGISTDLWMQHIDASGNLLWSGSEYGILVCGIPNYCARWPRVAPDSSGGVFVVWNDGRPLYSALGASFSQHLDENGNILWPQDKYICDAQDTKIIPDGEGGIIVQANFLDENMHWRIDGNGNILWTRDYLSYYPGADMVTGEPGFFYLSFTYNYNAYSQRMDINGNNYWPTSGAQMASLPAGWTSGPWVFHSYYLYPYLYSEYI